MDLATLIDALHITMAGSPTGIVLNDAQRKTP